MLSKPAGLHMGVVAMYEIVAVPILAMPASLV
jgi:hypothetical protein